MKRIDWSYHRNGCKTCARTQEFLLKHGIDQPAEIVDARKNRLGPKEALALLKDADKLYVAKGKNVVFLDLTKDKPDQANLLSLLMGPTGNLRAPTLKIGKTFIVGFDEAAYKKILC